MKVRVTVAISREFEVDEEHYHMPHPDASLWECVTHQEIENHLDDPGLILDYEDTSVVVHVEELDVSPARTAVATR